MVHRIYLQLLIAGMMLVYSGCSQSKPKGDGPVNYETYAMTGASIKIEQYIPYHDTLKKIKNYIFAGQQQLISTMLRKVEPAVVSLGILQSTVDGTSISYIGSGVIIAPQGYVLSSADVIKENYNLRITVFEKNHQRQFNAIVVALDPEADLALIKIQPSKSYLFPFVSIDNYGRVTPGDWLFAVGSEDGMSIKLKPGIVSSVNRTKRKGGRYFYNLIETDIRLGRGFIGCPVFDVQGVIVGLYIDNGFVLSVNQPSPILGFNKMW